MRKDKLITSNSPREPLEGKVLTPPSLRNLNSVPSRPDRAQGSPEQLLHRRRLQRAGLGIVITANTLESIR